TTDSIVLSFLSSRPPPTPTLFPYTTLFRSQAPDGGCAVAHRRLRPRHAKVRSDMMTTRVNLLPHREERRKRGRQHFFVLAGGTRSEEHTSELQSPYDLVCRLLLEKKKKYTD